MLKKFALTAAVLVAGPAFADGDIAAGEKAFRQCVSCHVVVDGDGNTLAGRKAQTGPNLYGVAGRTMGSVEDFKYSSLLQAANEQGVVFDEAFFVKYTMDPTGATQEATGESSRGAMTYKVRKEEDSLNLYAYLASLAPAAEEAAEETPAEGTVTK
jgi:cytochrome c